MIFPIPPSVAQRLAELPECERAIVTAMMAELCEIELMGPASALEVIAKVSRLVLKEKRGRNGRG